VLAVLRQRGFFLVWLAGLISAFGDWVLAIALPVYVYERTGSAVATGAMFAAEMLPRVLFGSVAGVFVDRWDRKWMMVGADGARGVLLLALLGVQSVADFWLVYVIAFLQSAVGQFFEPARSALMPRLVAADQLVAANALTSQWRAVVRIVGPPLGGVMMLHLGLPGVVVADSLSFVLSAVLIAFVAAPGAPDGRIGAPAAAVSRWASVWIEWRAGLGLIARKRVLTVLVAALAVTSVADGMIGPQFVVFVKHVLRGDAAEVGWWVSTNAVGGLVGGVFMTRLARSRDVLQMLGFGLAAVGVLTLARNSMPAVLAVVTPGTPPAVAMLVNPAIGAVAVGAWIAWQTSFQQAVPDEYRGRVFGSADTTFALLTLIGIAGGSLLAEAVGVLAVFNAMGMLYALAGLLVLVLLGRP